MDSGAPLHPIGHILQWLGCQLQQLTIVTRRTYLCFWLLIFLFLLASAHDTLPSKDKHSWRKMIIFSITSSTNCVWRDKLFIWESFSSWRNRFDAAWCLADLDRYSSVVHVSLPEVNAVRATFAIKPRSHRQAPWILLFALSLLIVLTFQIANRPQKLRPLNYTTGDLLRWTLIMHLRYYVLAAYRLDESSTVTELPQPMSREHCTFDSIGWFTITTRSLHFMKLWRKRLYPLCFAVESFLPACWCRAMDKYDEAWLTTVRTPHLFVQFRVVLSV